MPHFFVVGNTHAHTRFCFCVSILFLSLADLDLFFLFLETEKVSLVPRHGSFNKHQRGMLLRPFGGVRAQGDSKKKGKEKKNKRVRAKGR